MLHLFCIQETYRRYNTNKTPLSKRVDHSLVAVQLRIFLFKMQPNTRYWNSTMVSHCVVGNLDVLLKGDNSNLANPCNNSFTKKGGWEKFLSNQWWPS